MPRIRTIKPDFWTNPQVARVSHAARLLFIATWNMADDHGNLPRDSEKLKMQVFPSHFDVDVDVEPLVVSLISNGLLIEYSDSNTGGRFLHVPTFHKHQVINRPSKPIYPLPEKALLDFVRGRNSGDFSDDHVWLTESSRTEVEVERGSGKGSKPKTIGTKERGGRATRASATHDDEHEPVAVTPAMLSIVMRRHSIASSPSDPRLIAAVEQGITPATIEAACVEGRASNKGGRLRAGYVIAIAVRWTQEAEGMKHANGDGNGNSNPSGARRSKPASFDTRAEDRKRTIEKLTGRDKRNSVSADQNVIDVDMTEIAHESRHTRGVD
ncbi:hypothetical protein [Paraburkholderia bannensis]|uniref:hypothetical protein n=1 Tax=Paraburkholderia bannensis TaxID=765414 RepID=UPI002AC3273B|nr:hypothetical protein [Paraburkholderia bannensis]